MDKANKTVIFSSLILGLSLIIGAALVSGTIFSIKKLNDTLSVTGSTKQQITSDQVKWRSSFSRNAEASNLQAGYAQMKNDEKAVLKFLKDGGVSEDKITVSPVTMMEVYKPNYYDQKEYALTQNVVVSSMEVDKITSLSKNVQPLVDKGVIFSTQAVEYYISKLPELRVSLLSAAMKDAKERAEKIAESAGKKVGAVQSADMGVVQVMSVNSVEVSDYGAYDTSNIEKEVMVTVKAVFRLN